MSAKYRLHEDALVWYVLQHNETAALEIESPLSAVITGDMALVSQQRKDGAFVLAVAVPTVYLSVWTDDCADNQGG